MSKVAVVGMVVVMVLSLAVSGTILAQDDGETTGTAWLGISTTETDDGVAVRRVVTGSPAAAGGLLVGDVLVSMDGAAIDSADTLTALVQAHQPGDVVSVVVMRNDSERTLEIELGSDDKTGHDVATDVDSVTMTEIVLHVSLTPVDGGFQVGVVGTRSSMDLQDGDILTAINGQAIDTLDWSALRTELAESDDPVLTLSVLRDGEELTIEHSWSGHSGGHREGPSSDRTPGGKGGGRGGSRDDVPSDSGQSGSTGVSSPAPVVSGSPA